MTVQFTPDLRDQYQLLWGSCQPHDPAAAAKLAAQCAGSRARYEEVAAVVNPAMPWHFVALVHHMECSGRFDCHLHNGDPLTARTVHVPAGRPFSGEPPYQWEASAVDALELQGLHAVSDWSLPGELYRLERYNGFGYRHHGILTPYLWAGSDHYESGKFTADGAFDPLAVSKQIGAAVILRAILETPAAT